MSKPAATPDAPAPEAAAAPPKAWLGKVKIAGIVAVIMIGELVAVLMVIPRGESAPAAETEHSEDAEHGEEAAEHGGGHGKKEGHGGGHGGGHGKKEGGHGGHGAKETPVKSGAASEEVDLGEFSVTSYQPAASTTLFISFHLFGTLQHKNSEELQRRLEDNKHRIRDNIIVIIRSAEITDLTDAGLGLIKRRILETTNKTLGKPLLQAVIFSEFSFVEQ